MTQLLLSAASLTAGSANLNEALARLEARLDVWATNTTAYNSLLQQVFTAAGTDAALWQQAADALQGTLTSTGLAIPLELLEGNQLPGINGAYTAGAASRAGSAGGIIGGERIYLNGAWLESASAEQVETVLLEELGHAIDARLNGNADSPGDEGAIFSALLRGYQPTAGSILENDQRLLMLDGQILSIEADDTTAPVAISTTPAFAPAVDRPFGLASFGYGASPAFADIDGDGDLDAFIGTKRGSTFFLRNTAATGATAPAFTFSPTSFGLTDVGEGASLAFADIDGDGDLDAFIGEREEGFTFFFLNTGDPATPSFAAASTNPFGLTKVGTSANPSFVDIDGDGDLDAFIGNRDGFTFFFRNTGGPATPSFAEATINPFGLPLSRFRSAIPRFVDIEGDGDFDFFISESNGTFFLRNTGSTTAPAFAGSSSAFALLLGVGRSSNPAFADIDGDGDLDAFIGEPFGNTLFFRNTAPALGVGSPTANGTYRPGDVITLTVRFSEAVVVNTSGGTPTLQLETGNTDRFASFTGGSGTDTLTFSYTVQPGDVSSDLDLLSTGALTLNGATIRDAAGNNAVLSLAALGSPASLAAKKDLAIGSVAFITAVNSPSADGAYRPGAVIEITLTFSEAVRVAGAPRLLLETGSTDRFATYTGGSGTDTLTFAYTVQDGDNNADLDLISRSALSLNGGSIKDLVFLNDAGLLLPAPGTTSSLGASKNLVVDGLGPVAINGTPAFAAYSNNFRIPGLGGSSANPAFVDIDGDGDLDAYIGGRLGFTSFFPNTGSATAPAFAFADLPGFNLPNVFRYASPAFADIDGDGDLDAFIGNYFGNTLFSRNTGSATAPAFVPLDSAFGLPDVGSNASPSFVDIDGDGDLDAIIGEREGRTNFYRNTGSATAPAFAEGNFASIGGVGVKASPSFVDIDGDGDLDAFIGNGNGNTLFLRNIGSATAPAFASPASAFGITNVGRSASPSFVDIDGDGDLDALIGNGSGDTIFFRNTAPALGVGSPTANGTYRRGDEITLTVRFSEAVVVVTSAGTPTLQLETGSIDRFATFTGGSGTDTLSFAYTVQPGDVSSDLDLLSANALALNGATIRDAAGNNALLTLAAPGTPASLAAKKDLVIVGAAVITAVNSPTPDGTYGPGAVIQISIAFSEAVVVTGSPLLALETGSIDRFASFTGGSGTDTLTFAYTVQDGDITADVDLLSATALSLNGGSIKDLVLSSDARLLLPAPGTAGSLGANRNLVIDALGPQITAFAATSDSTSGVSISSGFSFTANEAGTAELLPATGPALISTPFLANTPTLITLAAQAAVTSTSLVLTDGLGNRSTAPTQVVLGTSSNDAVVALAGDEVIGGFQGSDSYRFDTDLSLGSDTLLDPSFSGADTLDFSATSSRSIAIDLRGNRPQPQVINDGLTLGFAPRTKIENVNGGAAGNTITGNLLNNNLQGGSSNDSLAGLDGNDILSGGDGIDSLDGGNGNDLIIGGTGNDTLIGGAGVDRFRFDAPLNVTSNLDTIIDFSLALGDRIELGNSVFTAFTTTGNLAATAFFIGDSATTADHRVLYNTATGLLSFDSDGNGAAAAIAFATLTPGLALTAASFLVI